MVLCIVHMYIVNNNNNNEYVDNNEGNFLVLKKLNYLTNILMMIIFMLIYDTWDS